jgi:hypothetical protein
MVIGYGCNRVTVVGAVNTRTSSINLQTMWQCRPNVLLSKLLVSIGLIVANDNYWQSFIRLFRNLLVLYFIDFYTLESTVDVFRFKTIPWSTTQIDCDCLTIDWLWLLKWIFGVCKLKWHKGRPQGFCTDATRARGSEDGSPPVGFRNFRGKTLAGV